MKHKRPIILAAIGLLLVMLVCYYMSPPPSAMQEYSIRSHQRIMRNLETQSEKKRSEAEAARMPHMVDGFMPGMTPTNYYVEPPTKTNEPIPPAPVIDPKYSNPTNWPDDPRPEAKRFHQFAKIAHLYNFDPNVTYDKDEKFPHFRKAVGTSTHEAQLDTRNNRIVSFYSYQDRSSSLVDFPDFTGDWKNGTGKWNDEQMINETFRILREMGYAETLAATSPANRLFIPEPWRITLPDGSLQVIYPFAKVKLYDEAGNNRVTAEYRMGSDGPVGLVDWFSPY